MAEGLNRALLIGNLGQDPELRYTQSGQAVLSLRIATNDSFVNRDGERQERTEWHSVTIWGKRGEALSKILTKGQKVFVEGRLQTRSWEDKNGGGKRYATEINAQDIILLGGGRGAGPRTNYDEGGPPPRDEEGGGAPSRGSMRPNDAPPDDDDIPF